MVFRLLKILAFFIWGQSSFGSEVLEYSTPSFTHFYSSYSIFFWSFMVLVVSLFCALFISISYIKRKNHLERKIKKWNQELEERVALRTQQLKEQQAKAVQASKLASLGEMAAGVAHEINNPLTIIKMLTSKVKRYERSDEVDKLLVRVDDQINRITDIIIGMKNISRDGSTMPLQKFSFNQILYDTKIVCRNKFHNAGVALEVEEVDEAVKCLGVPVQISQVLLNLLNNSFDAVRENEDADCDSWIRITPSLQDCFLRIDVEDSGKGIDPSIVDKILDPFYTTKNFGKGTGLGLSVSRRIMEKHDGELFLDSSKKNTCFSILIPRVGKKIEAKKNGPQLRTNSIENQLA